MGLVLLMAACGDGDSEETADIGDESTEAAVEATETDDSETGDGETDDTGTVSGDSGSDWCDAIRAAADEEGSPLDFNLVGLPPEEVEARMKANLDELERWEAMAPPEIETQVGTLVDGYRTFISMGDAAEWDLVALANDPDFAAALNTDEVTQAADDVDAYSRDVCGVDVGVDATGDGGTAGDAGDTAGSGAGAGDDMATVFLDEFGLSPNFLTDEQLACMNDQLAAAFPDGLPDDLALTPDNVELFDTAGAACGIGN